MCISTVYPKTRFIFGIKDFDNRIYFVINYFRVWFVSRAVLKVQAEGYDDREKINNKKSRAFQDLMDRKLAYIIFF